MTYDVAIQIIDRIMAARADRYPDEPAERDAIRHKVATAVSLFKSENADEVKQVLREMLIVAEQRTLRQREHHAA